MGGGNHTEVEAMRIMHQPTLAIIPTGIEKFFPNLKGLSFLNCNVRSITKDHLVAFPEMLQVSYNLNQIEVIPGDLFIYTPKLKLVNFAGNNIKHIGVGLFKPLKQLDYIWLEKNVCIDMNSRKKELKKLNKEIRKSCRMGGKSDCKKIPLAFRFEKKTEIDTCEYVHVYRFKQKPMHELIRLQREKEEKEAKDREHHINNILRICEADSPLLRYFQVMLNEPGQESLPQFEPPSFDFVKLEKDTRKKNYKKKMKKRTKKNGKKE